MWTGLDPFPLVWALAQLLVDLVPGYGARLSLPTTGLNILSSCRLGSRLMPINDDECRVSAHSTTHAGMMEILYL